MVEVEVQRVGYDTTIASLLQAKSLLRLVEKRPLNQRSASHFHRTARAGRTLFSFELDEKVSPTFCVVDFSLSGWAEDASESPVPFSLSPRCSVVDFSESGLSAAPALSVRLWRPAGRRS
jgi:hypothetical protein